MAMNASNSSNLEQLALKGLMNVVANLTEKLHKMFSVPVHHALHTRISVFSLFAGDFSDPEYLASVVEVRK